jgi:hypothetical protein
MREQEKDNDLTDESEGEGEGIGENSGWIDGLVIDIGETVRCGKEDNEGTQSWTRLESLNEDARTEKTHETTFHNLRIGDKTTELGMFSNTIYWGENECKDAQARNRARSQKGGQKREGGGYKRGSKLQKVLQEEGRRCSTRVWGK